MRLKNRQPPIVTIGVCVRNCATFIASAIDSIASQDFPHELMEVIFVDDGSEDRTLSIIKNHVAKMDIKAKVFHGQWKGLGPARNIVVDNAEGDYIIWVDGDMTLPKDYVRKQVKFMEQNANVGICIGMMGIRPKENLILALEVIPSIVEYSYGYARKLPGTGGATYRIEALRQVGKFDENITGTGEDQDAAHRIKAANWLICPTNSIFYETHGNMSTWIALWRKYFLDGFTSHYLYRQNKKLFFLPLMAPPVGFIAGLLYSLEAYRIINRKMVFLLPLHYAFKMSAWCLGFAKGLRVQRACGNSFLRKA